MKVLYKNSEDGTKQVQEYKTHKEFLQGMIDFLNEAAGAEWNGKDWVGEDITEQSDLRWAVHWDKPNQPTYWYSEKWQQHHTWIIMPMPMKVLCVLFKDTKKEFCQDMNAMDKDQLSDLIDDICDGRVTIRKWLK